MLQLKKELRQQALLVRQSLDIQSVSELIVSNLLKMTQFQSAKNIFGFYPFKNEIDITSLFQNYLKTWYLPRVTGDEMELCPYKVGDKLQVNRWGIYEPTNTKLDNFEMVDFVIAPALMADFKGYRLGYGKGFYDRFFAQYTGVSCILLPDELLVKDLPNESFDKSCDLIVTQSRVIICNRTS